MKPNTNKKAILADKRYRSDQDQEPNIIHEIKLTINERNHTGTWSSYVYISRTNIKPNNHRNNKTRIYPEEESNPREISCTYKPAQSANTNPDTISKTGYNVEIGFLQYSHFPFWRNREKTGIRLCRCKVWLQWGHWERPYTNDLIIGRVIFLCILCKTTDPNDPKTNQSKKNKITVHIIYSKLNRFIIINKNNNTRKTMIEKKLQISSLKVLPWHRFLSFWFYFYINNSWIQSIII